MALVVAFQRLLLAALREPRNQRFLLLSESCGLLLPYIALPLPTVTPMLLVTKAIWCIHDCC